MPLTPFQKIMLGISGITALGIGGVILATPHAFYAGYDIAIGDSVGLLSELRAFAAGLATLGAVMLAGIVRAGLRAVSVTSALAVFLGFPAGRLVGMSVDGVPSAGILAALTVELAIGALCLIAFRDRLMKSAPDAPGGRAATHLT